jgi:hypothetical protein
MSPLIGQTCFNQILHKGLHINIAHTCFHHMRAPAAATPRLCTRSPMACTTAPLKFMLWPPWCSSPPATRNTGQQPETRDVTMTLHQVCILNCLSFKTLASSAFFGLSSPEFLQGSFPSPSPAPHKSQHSVPPATHRKRLLSNGIVGMNQAESVVLRNQFLLTCQACMCRLQCIPHCGQVRRSIQYARGHQRNSPGPEACATSS